jgi:hypothetical protein
MRLFKSGTSKEWNEFLRTASDEDLVEARNRWRTKRNEATAKMREIQQEVDARLVTPEDKGQVINFNG